MIRFYKWLNKWSKKKIDQCERNIHNDILSSCHNVLDKNLPTKTTYVLYKHINGKVIEYGRNSKRENIVIFLNNNDDTFKHPIIEKDLSYKEAIELQYQYDYFYTITPITIIEK